MKHYLLGKRFIYDSTAATRIEEQLAIRISNYYCHISQSDWGCIKIFHHCNIIIVGRVIFRIKLFIVVYVIYVLILRIYVLLCIFRFFYIIDANTLTRSSCIVDLFPTYLCEMIEQTTMITFLTQSRAHLTMR